MTQPTATHRFVTLALHVAYQGDGELQPEERDALALAAHQIGIAAGIPKDQVQQMVYDASAAYHEAHTENRVEAEVRAATESLGIFREPIRRSLLMHLREVAKAHGGVNIDEHELLTDLREAWGVDLTARA